MLQTEEVDDDFFTPVSSTSLASIFGHSSKSSEVPDNDTLKYVPPKPQNINSKPPLKKATECILADVVTAHEWEEHQYKSRGRLGFAVIKYLETGQHRVILYDSNKTTVSHTVITPDLEFIVKNSSHISFYDNQRKYWSLYPKAEKLQDITSCLESYGAKIKYCTYKDNAFTFTNQDPPELTDNADTEVKNSAKDDKKDLESDTDSSSINKKTKAAILQRMAHMGQSVLPPKTLPQEESSASSSDSGKTDSQPKTIRHKPVKTVCKKIDLEHVNIKSERLNLTESMLSQNAHLMPIGNTTFISGPTTDFSMFMSEQRISNSELRININRITDKVDLVLDKINNQSKDTTSNAQTNIILMKLLTEYENKIKAYEEILNSRSVDHNEEGTSASVDNDSSVCLHKITTLDKANEDKDIEILSLREEIKKLKEEAIEEKHNQLNKEKELQKQIIILESNLSVKNEEIENLIKGHKSSNEKESNKNVVEKVKSIMNDTFQTISMNFDDKEEYTGENVKKIVGTAIKKITISALHEL